MPRSTWLLLTALVFVLLLLSLRSATFEICNDGCTMLPLRSKYIIVAARKSFSLFRTSKGHVSLDTSWLGPFSLRFIIRNGLLIVYPGLPLSLMLVVSILYIQYTRSVFKPRSFSFIARSAAALLLVMLTHSDVHSRVFGSEYQGYNHHVPKHMPVLQADWFWRSFNCSAKSFPSFGRFRLVSSGTAPCLIYKFSGTVGFDETDCDVVCVSDGKNPTHNPYGPFWKRAIFLKDAASGLCLDSGAYKQIWYADNDNIVTYMYQPNLTAPYYAMFRDTESFSTGINAVTLRSGHSAKIQQFSSEWLSYHDHIKVKDSPIHDMAPFREKLGSLNQFPSALNNAVNFKARHCARHTLNRNRCVRGGYAMANLELQIVNDMMSLQLFLSALFVALGGFRVAKMPHVGQCMMLGGGTVLLALLLGLEVGGALPLRDVSRNQLTKFTVWIRNKKYFVTADGVAASAGGRMLRGNLVNGFIAHSGDVLSWVSFALVVFMMMHVAARLLGTALLGICEFDRKRSDWGRVSISRGI